MLGRSAAVTADMQSARLVPRSARMMPGRAGDVATVNGGESGRRCASKDVSKGLYPELARFHGVLRHQLCIAYGYEYHGRD